MKTTEFAMTATVYITYATLLYYILKHLGGVSSFVLSLIIPLVLLSCFGELWNDYTVKQKTDLFITGIIMILPIVFLVGVINWRPK
jgi:hypothetical protein